MVAALHAVGAHLSHGCVKGRGRGCSLVSMASTDGECQDLRGRVALPYSPSPLPAPQVEGWGEVSMLDAASQVAALLSASPMVVSPSWSGTYRALRDLLHQAGGDGWTLTRTPPWTIDLGKLRRWGELEGVAVPPAADAAEALGALAALFRTERAWLDRMAPRSKPGVALARLRRHSPALAVAEEEVAVIAPLGAVLPEAPHLMPCLDLGVDGCLTEEAERYLAEGAGEPRLVTIDIGDIPLLAEIGEDGGVCENALPPEAIRRLLNLPPLQGERLADARDAAGRRNLQASGEALLDSAQCERDGEAVRQGGSWLASAISEDAWEAPWAEGEKLAAVAVAHARAHRAGDVDALAAASAEAERLCPNTDEAIAQAARELEPLLDHLRRQGAAPETPVLAPSAGTAA